jgi:hypothetical protein
MRQLTSLMVTIALVALIGCGGEETPTALSPEAEEALEVDIRNRVSRTLSDMRSMATALEAWRIDNAQYPPHLNVLTTPIAYVTRMMLDPFNVGEPFAYHRETRPDVEGWLLVSQGPDEDFDIDPARDYDGSAPQPTPALAARIFDPTNGTISDGDLVRWR